MITSKRPVFLIILFFVLAVVLSMAACARKKTSQEIVAVVNDYKMTVEDFNYEAKDVLRMGIIIGDIPVIKKDILDALIVKELLIQEAQKRNFDKDKNFMKTIELYWEQTLIKNLLTKKSREIERAITVYENEILDYYNKMREKIKATVLMLANEKTSRKLLKFKGDVAGHAAAEPEKSSLLYVIPSRIYTLGEDSSPLENDIFEISSSKQRELISINGKWAMIVIEERIPSEPEPFSDARDEIMELIKTKKEKELMDKWIDMLRSNAHIRINKKVLNKLR